MFSQNHYQIMPILTSASPSAKPKSASELSAATLVAALSSTDLIASGPPAAPTFAADPTTSDPATLIDPSTPIISSAPSISLTSSNGTATRSSYPVEVSAGAGVKAGLERAGSVLAVRMAVLTAL
jgi:hypothetical protein